MERLGTLQSTAAALKELADNSQELNKVFKTETRELITDIGSQLDAFGQFDDQQQRIEDDKRRAERVAKLERVRRIEQVYFDEQVVCLLLPRLLMDCVAYTIFSDANSALPSPRGRE